MGRHLGGERVETSRQLTLFAERGDGDAAANDAISRRREETLPVCPPCLGLAVQLPLFQWDDTCPAASDGLSSSQAPSSPCPRVSRSPRASVPNAPFHPLPWQIPAWRDTGPLILLTGSAGGGKSRLAAEKLHAYCQRYPGAMALMLRKTRESMVNSTVLFMARQVIGADPQVVHAPSRHRFEYANGSILAYGGMADEAQREQIRSIGQDGGLDIAWMEEASRFSEADFNELLPRMRGKAGPWRQIILTTNPSGPRHWINLRLIMGANATPGPRGSSARCEPRPALAPEATLPSTMQAAVYYSRAADNPHNPASYAAALNALTGVQRLRLRDGKWVQAEGAVYTAWDPAVHVVGDETLRGWGLWEENYQTNPIPGAGWKPALQASRVIASIDWGYTNPGVLQVWAVDGDGRMILLHELYQTRRLIDWWVEQARILQERYGIELYACDPSEPAYIAQFRRAGLNALPAENDLAPGIQQVQARLTIQADGRPRIYLRRGALAELDRALEAQGRPTCTEQELPDYTWAEGANGAPRKNLPELPLKVNDHGCDALRYAAMALQGAGPSVEYSSWG